MAIIRVRTARYLFISCLVVLVPPVLAQEEIVVIQSPIFGKQNRPVVSFFHDQHNEAAGIEFCNECHHVFENGRLLEGESSEDKLCSDCHGIKAAGRQPGLRKAFHNNCKGCHAKKNKGPVMCGQCHIQAK